jgi:hypothetical protein
MRLVEVVNETWLGECPTRGANSIASLATPPLLRRDVPLRRNSSLGVLVLVLARGSSLCPR